MNEKKPGPSPVPVSPNLDVAALYFAAAFASLHLAAPPGYATALWPAAGVAPGMMLLHGPRL